MSDDHNMQPADEQTTAGTTPTAESAPTTWLPVSEAFTPDSTSDTAALDAPASSPRRRVGMRAVSAVALVAVGAAGGAGISRALTSNSTSPSPSRSASGSNGTGANGFNNGGPGGFSGGGNYGYTPTAPGGSGFGQGGSSGFGSGGSSGFGVPGDGTGSGADGSGGSNAADGPTDAAAIARNVDPGVVDITTTVQGGEAAGTGMVLTSNGEILTNNHVIDGATSISVRDVGNGKTYQATVVGYDRTQDVAVLQLSGASGLTTVRTASSEPDSGATVVGIGNAGGTGGTPSYAGGSITGTNQSITASDEYDGTSEKLAGLLGTDANIEAGDSGGPLVNSSGQVVGMDTAASSGYSFDGGDGSGTTSSGFAIPITTALQIVDAIENGETSSTVHIGATAQLGVYVGSDQDGAEGAEVSQTASGGPAAKAGISAGDIITAVNGTSIGSAADLTAEMATLTPGKTVTVNYTTSAGESHSTQVTLGTGSPQ